jgi:RNase P subunit RPR2
MSSEASLFDELYAQAWNREHAVIADVKRLQHLTPSLVSIGRISRGLHDAHQDFLADLQEIAAKYKIQLPPDPKCPDCDDPDCPGAQQVKVAVLPFGYALLMKLLGK